MKTDPQILRLISVVDDALTGDLLATTKAEALFKHMDDWKQKRYVRKYMPNDSKATTGPAKFWLENWQVYVRSFK